MATYVFAKNGMGDYTTGTGMREDMLMQNFNVFVYQAGLIAPTDLEVTERGAGANMSVDVAAGRCFVLNSTYAVNTANSTRFWGMLLDGTENLSISTNTSGSDRFDIVIAKIDTGASPNDYATNVATVEVVEGNPGSGVPSTPTNSLKLAEISIPNGTTTQIVDSDITDTRQMCGHQGTDGHMAFVPSMTDGNILVYANQISSNIANTEEFRLVKIIVPSGFANTKAGNIQNAIDTLDAATVHGVVELLPGSHFIEEPIDITGSISVIGSSPYDCAIEQSSGTWSGSEVITFTTDKAALMNLSVHGSSGLTQNIDIDVRNEIIIDNVHIYNGSDIPAVYIAGAGDNNIIRARIEGNARAFVCEGDNNIIDMSCENDQTAATLSGDNNLVRGLFDVAPSDTGTNNDTSGVLVF